MAIRKQTLRDGKTSWGYCFDAPGSTRAQRRQIGKWGFPTKKAAQDAEAARRLESNVAWASARVAAAQPKPLSLGWLLNKFLAEHADKNLAPKTAERYREMVPYLSRELLARSFSEITALDLHSEWNRLRESGGHHRKTKAQRPLATKTVRNIAGMVSSVFSQGIFWELCTSNPARDSRPPRGGKREQIALTVEQQELLLDGSGHWQLPAFLELSASTGARRGEVLAVRWSDLQRENMFIGRSISQTKAGLVMKPPKNGTFREITLPGSTMAVLAAHRRVQDKFRLQMGSRYQADLDLVFANPDGSPLRPDSISAAVSNLRKKLKLPRGASLHTLRHTHGSHLLAAGMELPAVSARLGHSTVYVTASVYAHVLSGRDKEAAKKWEQFQGREPEKKRKGAVS